MKKIQLDMNSRFGYIVRIDLTARVCYSLAMSIGSDTLTQLLPIELQLDSEHRFKYINDGKDEMAELQLDVNAGSNTLEMSARTHSRAVV